MPDYPIYLHADLTRMGQVVSNLLNNAAKYTPKLGKIEVLVQLVNQEATISITDNGKGIPFDMVPKVFEIFTQIEHTVHRAQGGLGIGLALAKTIVEMHGGTIEAKSEGVEKGSTFTLKVPVLVQSEEISVINPSRIRNLPNRIRKILIVDDNIDGAQMLSLLFQSSGHQIMTAYNGNDALTIGAKFEPDYVFLDIGLPDINGYEVLRRLRQQSEMQKTIFIALTGWGSNADKRQAAEAGFDFHLTKPVDLNELDEILQMT